jgi:DNA polymerase III sliding clamp (beta) subunit (PCNA family)
LTKVRVIEASASASGESADEIEVETKGDDVVIAFNYRYLCIYFKIKSII